jgi:hypothetical protein
MPWRGPTAPTAAGAAPILLSSNPRFAEVVPKAWISVVSPRTARQIRRPRTTWTTKEMTMIATQTQIHTAVTLHRVLSSEHVARRRPRLVPSQGLPGRKYGVVLGSERSDDLSLPSEAQHKLP